jgi:hypothetical protein
MARKRRLGRWGGLAYDLLLLLVVAAFFALVVYGALTQALP